MLPETITIAGKTYKVTGITPEDSEGRRHYNLQADDGTRRTCFASHWGAACGAAYVDGENIIYNW